MAAELICCLLAQVPPGFCWTGDGCLARGLQSCFSCSQCQTPPLSTAPCPGQGGRASSPHQTSVHLRPLPGLNVASQALHTGLTSHEQGRSGATRPRKPGRQDSGSGADGLGRVGGDRRQPRCLDEAGQSAGVHESRGFREVWERRPPDPDPAVSGRGRGPGSSIPAVASPKPSRGQK